MDTRPHRLLFHRHIIVLHFNNPDIQSVVEPVEIHICPSVVVDEQRIVDALFISDLRFLLVLHERSQRRVGNSDADMLLSRKIHVKFVFQLVNLGGPEPFVAPDIFTMQSQSIAGAAFGPFPGDHIPGNPDLDAALGTRAVGVINPVVKQDERIGQRNFPQVIRRFGHCTDRGEQRRSQ